MKGRYRLDDDRSETIAIYYAKPPFALHRSLRPVVEMCGTVPTVSPDSKYVYQWVERSTTHRRRDTVGGGETEFKEISYHPEWRGDHVSSNSFKDSHVHHNPPFDTPDATFTADRVRVGPYSLSDGIVAALPAQSAVFLKETDTVRTGYKGITEAFTGNPSYPSVGDLRVHWTYTPEGTVSVLAVLDGSGALVSSRHNSQLPLVSLGTKSIDDLLAEKEATNAIVTWALRFLGWLLMFCGLCLIAEPANIVADILPPIGWATRSVTSFASLAVSLSFSLVTMAMAWIAYRPLYGGTLLAVAFGLCLFARGDHTRSSSRSRTE